MFFLSFIIVVGSCNAQNLLRGLANLTITNTTSGPTNPNFKPNIKGVPQNPGGGSAPPSGFTKEERLSAIKKLAGLQ